MFDGITCYQLAAYFIIYSFIGWVIEVMYHGVTKGKVVNRGFLNGPVCPVYGFGMTAVLWMQSAASLELPLRGTGSDEELLNLVVMFVIGSVFATAIELVAGWALDALFHTRWWDYSRLPFNFRGYICLKFSLIWGMGVVAALRLLHPFLKRRTVDRIPERVGWPILAVLFLIYLADVIVTVAVLIGIDRKLHELDVIRESMRKGSDDLSRVIGKGTIRAAQNIQEGQVQAALAKMEFHDLMEEGVEELRTARDDLRERREERAELLKMLLTKRFSVSRRLLKAFPDLKNRDHEALVAELKELVNEHRTKLGR